MKRFLTLFSLFSFCTIIHAQIIFQEDFEKGSNTAPFLASDYFKTPCNSSIVKTTEGVNCVSYIFQKELTVDVSGNGYFLFHPTPYKLAGQEYIGTCWGTLQPIKVMPNTSYRFSFWVANAFADNFALFQLFIDGLAVGLPVQAQNGFGNQSWTKLSVCWNAGNQTEVNLRIDDLIDTAKGNDFAIDNIVFEKIGTAIPTLVDVKLCNAKNYFYNNINYTQSGIYDVFLKRKNGCDSLVKLNLVLNESLKLQQNVELCSNQTYTIGKNTYKISGTYIDTLKGKNTCDTILTTHLKIEDFIAKKKNVELCLGQSIKINNKLYTLPGVFGDTIKAFVGCDTVLTIEIKIKDFNTKNQKIQLCQGKNIKINNKFYDKTGIFIDTIKASIGCDTIFTLNLTIIDSIEIKIKQDTTIIEGQSVQLNPLFNIQNTQWTWSPKKSLSCSTCFSTIARPNENTIYEIKGTDNQGCKYYGKVTVKVTPICHYKLFIPNTFSPNDDGTNDVFTIFSNDCVVSIKKMKIFDRWGNLVFETQDFPSNNPDYGWKGTFLNNPANASVYTYLIEVEDFFKEIQIYKGDVILVR